MIIMCAITAIIFGILLLAITPKDPTVIKPILGVICILLSFALISIEIAISDIEKKLKEKE